MANPSKYCPPGCSHQENVARQNANLSRAGENLATRHSPTAGAALGSVHSRDKTKAAQANGQKGGRPVGS